MDDNPYAVRQEIEQRPLPWEALDDYLFYTCGVVRDLGQGRVAERPPIPTMARLEPGEQSLAVGPAARASWRALGNGSYMHSSTVAFGSPTFVIGTMAASALGNAARRNQAEANAQPRWVADGPGEITITDRRAYFAHPQRWLNLTWTGLDTVDLVAPDVLQCAFNSSSGKFLTVRLHTLWASLMFVLAAQASFPAHPRLLFGGWLPPGFEAKCAAFGLSCPPVR